MVRWGIGILMAVGTTKTLVAHSLQHSYRENALKLIARRRA
jgi:hypothetical protein